VLCPVEEFTMSIAERAEAIDEPVRRRWTVEEYHRAADAGIFGPEERLELINGEIFCMTAQKGPHSAATGLTEAALQVAFASGWIVRVQMPLILDGDAEPEPDLAVVRGTWRDYARDQPTTAVLVVEVADTSLRFDRQKAALYARAEIPDYWILNLPERLLEVYRDPDQATQQYQTITRLSENDTLAPLAYPASTIAVRDLLP
jgi:Uma2 family endonuclease